MSKCPEPGDDGYSFNLSFPLLLHVAQLLSQRAGDGLQLYNAIRERWAEISNDDAARLAATVRAGRVAAMNAFDPARYGEIDYSGSPSVPQSVFDFADTESRLYAEAQVVAKGSDGSETVTTYKLFLGEDADVQEVRDQIVKDRQQQIKDESPELDAILQEVLAYFYFLGKRF